MSEHKTWLYRLTQNVNVAQCVRRDMNWECPSSSSPTQKWLHIYMTAGPTVRPSDVQSSFSIRARRFGTTGPCFVRDEGETGGPVWFLKPVRCPPLDSQTSPHITLPAVVGPRFMSPCLLFFPPAQFVSSLFVLTDPFEHFQVQRDSTMELQGLLPSNRQEAGPVCRQWFYVTVGLMLECRALSLMGKRRDVCQWQWPCRPPPISIHRGDGQETERAAGTNKMNPAVWIWTYMMVGSNLWSRCRWKRILYYRQNRRQKDGCCVSPPQYIQDTRAGDVTWSQSLCSTDRGWSHIDSPPEPR